MATLLARRKDDSFQLSTASADELDLQLARLYVSAAEYDQSIRVLYRYHQAPTRAAYSDADYLAFSEALDEEAARLIREAEETLRAPLASGIDEATLESNLQMLKDRSERLADVAEKMQVSPRLEAAHRFRVLACNALNESNFEAQQFVKTQDLNHRRRAALLREASRTALQEAEDRQKDVTGR